MPPGLLPWGGRNSVNSIPPLLLTHQTIISIILPSDIKFKFDTSFFPTMVFWVGQTVISRTVTMRLKRPCSYAHTQH